jgi:hypothetical protein
LRGREAWVEAHERRVSAREAEFTRDDLAAVARSRPLRRRRRRGRKRPRRDRRPMPAA